jgi:hypothetical protein
MNDTAPMAKFDVPTLRGIEAASNPSPVSILVPRNMGEAMEFAKMMAATRFVPPHLRGNAGDCLAVVMFASRVEADPFAVASKTYFVNDRMAFEAQLVMALINTRAPLVGRLSIDWAGEGNNLVCTVTGKLRGDPQPKIVTQEIATITTKNSPLWKTSPRQQLGYLTARMWGRLHCPEVLLGIYTPDEIQDMGALERNEDGTYMQAPPRPTRAEFVKAEPVEPQWRLFNLSGEIAASFENAEEFVDALIGHMKECDGRGLEAAEEYHREQVADLSDDLRGAIADAYDAALKALPRR